MKVGIEVTESIKGLRDTRNSGGSKGMKDIEGIRVILRTHSVYPVCIVQIKVRCSLLSCVPIPHDVNGPNGHP